MDTIYYIKARAKTLRRKPFRFITNSDYTNRLKIHAARFTLENVTKAITELRADNPDSEFRIYNNAGRVVREPATVTEVK
jgi:hypothetical protein